MPLKKWIQLESDRFLSFIDNIPSIYSSNIGPEMNHMVIPLPSGVITAPKIMIISSAYLKFLNQKSKPTKPAKEIANIINGS